MRSGDFLSALVEAGEGRSRLKVGAWMETGEPPDQRKKRTGIKDAKSMMTNTKLKVGGVYICENGPETV